ncbi:MAG: hypothetical protein DYG92_02065 [Leptolyngbya sp. PLA1]|nr:hypothetical protein [Leptolyngbya sp. PLA1]
MFWDRLSRRRGVQTPEAMRRQHSRWLTRAFANGREYPRIPVRVVSVGGFSKLMARPGGPMLAERWWALAMARVDDPDTDG